MSEHSVEKGSGRVLRHKPEFTTDPDAYDIPPLPSVEKDTLVKVLKKHRVTRDGISTSYFGPTLGWWRCTCGWTSEKLGGYHRDRLPDAPVEHVADALLSSVTSPEASDQP